MAISPLYDAGIPEPHDRAAWDLYSSSPELQAKAAETSRRRRIKHNKEAHGREDDDNYCGEHFG